MRWVIDPGHGGRELGVYMTAGKRSPDVPPGVYEGACNRNVARMIIGPNIINLCPGPCDIPIRTRVKTINKLATESNERLALVSIHANASGNKWDESAHGWRIFHAPMASDYSRKLAEIMDRAFHESYEIPTSNREPKAGAYGILMATKCPSILIECGFMTSLRDCEYLKRPHVIAHAIQRGMKIMESIS